jgi:hypothetical protein
MSKRPAVRKAKAEAEFVRVYDEDLDLPGGAFTADLRPNRLNLHITGGIVVKAFWG